MAENEFEVGGEISLPLTAKFSMRYKRKWEDRGRDYLEDLADETGLSPSEINARVENDDNLDDLVLEGLSKASRTADPAYRQALARVVAAAFTDSAQVDEIEQLTSQLIQLDPLALRVMRAVYGNGDGGVTPGGQALSGHKIRKEIAAPPEVVVATLARLAAFGFIASATSLPTVPLSKTISSYKNVIYPVPRIEHYWQTTNWGSRAAELCFRHLPEAIQPDDRG